MARPFTLLVLGGYGVFGSRLCRRLAPIEDLRVLIAGRNSDKAAAFAKDLTAKGAQADFQPLRLDLTQDLMAHLCDVDALVHTAGPFQGQDYRVAKACIAAEVPYIDLADGRDFVCGFGQLDAAARAAGSLAVTGASSVPALSAAVTDRYRQDFVTLESIAMGITPGNRIPRGAALVEGILSYVGQPLPRWREGVWTKVHGWQDLKRKTVTGLKPRWFSTCDIPDLTLFPARYPEVRTVTFHAGLELGLLHLSLWALSWPVRWRLLPRLTAFKSLFHPLANATAFLGSDRGGMYVELTGRGPDGAPLRLTWELTARSGDGPYTPTIAAALLVKKLKSGTLTATGAGPCLDFFTLEEFLAEIEDLDVTVGVRRNS